MAKSDINLPIAYPVKSVNVLAPEGSVKLTSAQLTSAGSRQTQSGNMVNFVGGNLAAGSSLAMQLSAPNVAAPGGRRKVPLVTASPTSPSSALLLVAVPSSRLPGRSTTGRRRGRPRGTPRWKRGKTNC
jgi:hypothetical protein